MGKKRSNPAILGPALRSLLSAEGHGRSSAKRKSKHSLVAANHRVEQQLGCVSLISCQHCGMVDLAQSGRVDAGLSAALAKTIRDYYSKQDTGEALYSDLPDESTDTSTAGSSASAVYATLAAMDESVDDGSSSVLSELPTDQEVASDDHAEDDDTSSVQEAGVPDDIASAAEKGEGNNEQTTKRDDAAPQTFYNLFDEKISQTACAGSSSDIQVTDEENFEDLFENIRNSESIDSVKSSVKIKIAAILSNTDFVAQDEHTSSKSRNTRKGRASGAVSKRRQPQDEEEQKLSGIISALSKPLSDAKSEEESNSPTSRIEDQLPELPAAQETEVIDSQLAEEKEEAEPFPPEVPAGPEEVAKPEDIEIATADKEPDLEDNMQVGVDSPPSSCDSDDLVIRATRRSNGKEIPSKIENPVVESSPDHSEDESSDEAEVGSSSGEGNSAQLRMPASSSASDSPSDVELSKGKERKKRLRVYTSEEESEEQLFSSDSDVSISRNRRRRKRKAKSLSEVGQSTLYARKLELERRKRIEERQKLYNSVSSGNAEEAEGQSGGHFVLEMSEDGSESIVVVHERLAACMKSHQREGVQFLYNNTIETYKKAALAGNGCILAHSMGLGKSLQVIAYLYVVMSNEHIGMKSALVLSPLNVVLNWKNEFDLWLFNKGLNLEVFTMSGLKSPRDRIVLLKNWKTYGGVLIMGYDMFRIMVNGNGNERVIAEALLDPGPDVVVCDEAHILKNDKTGISKALNQIRTKRRICLTGTPLQNSLMEYYCMVNFVKPDLLGTKKEFSASFVNPIRNGQMSDSTPLDVRVMKQRSHILHKLLSGFVQRVGYENLEGALFVKHEYILYVRLSPMQVDLYNRYLDVVVKKLDLKSLKARNSLFQDFQSLRLVWSHPRALFLQEDRSSRKLGKTGSDSEEEGETTPMNSSAAVSPAGTDDSVICLDETDDAAPYLQPVVQLKHEEAQDHFQSGCLDGSAAATVGEAENPGGAQWFKEITAEADCTRLELSGKMALLFKILEKCAEIGDKLLLFSQSLLTLNVIEEFLALNSKDDEADSNDDEKEVSASCLLPTGRWVKGIDYLRLDGSTPPEARKQMSARFNDPNDLRCRLLLVSIRAGSLGINLIGSNRVVIFDANWNPTHEMQAMFRVIRLGQTKPVYVYRFIALETMESVIYGRQVVKQSLAYRVVDDWQIERHFSGSDLVALYNKTKAEEAHEPTRQQLHSLPKDRLLADILSECGSWVAKYHEHDSLLKNVVEETLTEEELKTAWIEYETEKRLRTMEKRSSIVQMQGPTSAVTVSEETYAETDVYSYNHEGVLTGGAQFEPVPKLMRWQNSSDTAMAQRLLQTLANNNAPTDSQSSFARIFAPGNAARAKQVEPVRRLVLSGPNRTGPPPPYPGRTVANELSGLVGMLRQPSTASTNGDNRRSEKQDAGEEVNGDQNGPARMRETSAAAVAENAKRLLEPIINNSEVCYMMKEFEKTVGCSALGLLAHYQAQHPTQRISVNDVRMVLDNFKRQLFLRRQQQQLRPGQQYRDANGVFVNVTSLPRAEYSVPQLQRGGGEAYFPR